MLFDLGTKSGVSGSLCVKKVQRRGSKLWGAAEQVAGSLGSLRRPLAHLHVSLISRPN